MAFVETESELACRVARAVSDGLGVEISPQQALIRPAADGRSWDYQSNLAMSLAKELGRPPRDVASAVVDSLQVEDLAPAPTIGGPGFINFRLSDGWIDRRLAERFGDERLGIPEDPEPALAVVDYSAPNVAKEMHVGHLRSTIIGDGLVRMLRFRGHEVVPQNHLGDWGTPFGMLIEHMLDDSKGSPGQGDYSVSDLNAFYQQARTRFDTEPDFRERARRRLVDLQRGDPETDALWRRLVAESERHFAEVYELLDVELTHDDLAPESMYNDRLAAVVEEFDQKGLTVESDGATVVFLPGFVGRTGEPVPLILRKSDGGYTYDTTDLAAIRYRIHDLGARELLYVVGVPQRLHLQMVFEAARAAGWLTDDIEALHIAFGSVLGEDGKMLRTRAGGAVRLVELLEEAIERAAGLLEDRPELDAEARRRLARAVGIGAVKYADLSTDRERDYVFSFDRMLSLDGNTSVYLQYANARARSVLARSSGRPGGDLRFQLVEEAERMLALRLLRLPAAVQQTLADMRPNKLCNYLYDLAVTFSTFYETCPVLAAPTEELRHSRLALCELTSRTLELGLGLLGIAAPEQL